MRLVVVSDTHGFHTGMQVPDGDVLVCCGDWSRGFGSWLDTVRFARWMAKWPHEHKLVTPGNHDYAVHENMYRAERLFEQHGCVLVAKRRVEIDGVVFDGGPWGSESGANPAWGFECPKRERERHWGLIGNVDVLITHFPPHGVLDETRKGARQGCPVLRRHVLKRIRPRLHLFGHTHEGHGVHEENGTTFVNASCCTRLDFAKEGSFTTMTMGIRDPLVYDLEVTP